MGFANNKETNRVATGNSTFLEILHLPIFWRDEENIHLLANRRACTATHSLIAGVDGSGSNSHSLPAAAIWFRDQSQQW